MLMKQQELTIEKIYKANKNVIYYSILNNIKNVEVVEELTNEVFLKFNKVLSESGFDDSKAKPLTYLYHIKKSVIVDYYRKKKLETNSDSGAGGSSSARVARPTKSNSPRT